MPHQPLPWWRQLLLQVAASKPVTEADVRRIVREENERCLVRLRDLRKRGVE